MALLIQLDGTSEEVLPKDGVFSAEELRGYLGPFDTIPLFDGRFVVSGPMNLLLFYLAMQAEIPLEDAIVSPVLFCSPGEITYPLPKDKNDD